MIDRNNLLERFVDQVLADNPTHSNFLNTSIASMPEESRKELLDYVEYCLSREISLTYLADCYNTVTTDTQREQIYFYRHGKYRYSSFQEAAARVYFDAEYMKKYMYGLALTAFLWPNHAAMYDFFVTTFPTGMTGTYLEVGPGHGYYFRKAAALGKFDRMIGIDISPASVELSNDIMRHHKVDSATVIQIDEADFLEYPSSGNVFSCIVMGEVLEHVEHPQQFLAKIAQLSDPNTHIYVTTCLNAPAIDHIFLFGSSAEVEAMVRSCGLDVEARFFAPYAGKSLAECEAERLAVNVAYVLRKA